MSSHYVTHLRDAILTDRHRLFLERKYKWSAQTSATVAWEALYTCARRTVVSQASTRSKLVHNWVNLGAQRASFGNNLPPSATERWCPYCKAPEDFLHLLTCVDPRALKARYEATAALNKAMSDGGAGPRALYRAIKMWCQHPAEPLDVAARTLRAQPMVDRALASQTTIGWLHVFRGFVSLDWGDFYSHDDATPLDIRKSEADKSLATVVLSVQNYTLAIWKSRNAVLHEANSTGSEIVHASLNQAITQLYGIRSTLSPILQSYFHLPLEDRLRRSPRQRKRWLRLAQLASSHATSRGSHQQLLSTYYPHAPQAPEYYRAPAISAAAGA